MGVMRDRCLQDMTAIYLRHVKRYEIMKVNSCHIPPRLISFSSFSELRE